MSTVNGTVNIDNWLDGNQPTVNRDGLGELRMGDQGGTNKARQVIRFTMPADPGGGATIDKIEAKLYLTSASGGVNMDTKVTRGTNTPATSWSESQSTYNVYSTGNNWTAAGAASDFSSSTIDSVTVLVASVPYYVTYVLYGTGADNPITATWGDVINLLWQQTDTAGTNYTGHDRLDANPPTLTVTYSTATAGATTPVRSTLALMGAG